MSRGEGFDKGLFCVLDGDMSLGGIIERVYCLSQGVRVTFAEGESSTPSPVPGEPSTPLIPLSRRSAHASGASSIHLSTVRACKGEGEIRKEARIGPGRQCGPLVQYWGKGQREQLHARRLALTGLRMNNPGDGFTPEAHLRPDRSRGVTE